MFKLNVQKYLVISLNYHIERISNEPIHFCVCLKLNKSSFGEFEMLCEQNQKRTNINKKTASKYNKNEQIFSDGNVNQCTTMLLQQQLIFRCYLCTFKQRNSFRCKLICIHMLATRIKQHALNITFIVLWWAIQYCDKNLLFPYNFSQMCVYWYTYEEIKNLFL